MNIPAIIYAHLDRMAAIDHCKLAFASNHQPTAGADTMAFGGRALLRIGVADDVASPYEEKPYNPTPELASDPYEAQRLLLRRWLIGPDREGNRLPIVCPAAGVRSGPGVALAVHWVRDGEVQAPVFVHLRIFAYSPTT